MIREPCYFMGGIADGCIILVSPKTRTFLVISNRLRPHTYKRTKLTNLAPHPLHGEWPLTVYVWAE